MTGPRFAVVATPGRASTAGPDWLHRVRTLEDQGWAAVLTPDTLWTPSPFPALAAAAAATTTLRLRTWVVAASIRTPGVLVREAAAVQLLSGGRFELGIGTGRGDVEAEAARLGAPWGSAAERIAAVEAGAAAVRAEVTPAPPVVVAGAGPRILALAGRIADRVSLAVPPSATVAELETAAAGVREAAAGRAVALTQQLVGIGERVPFFLAQQGIGGADLVAGGAVGMLPADPHAAADVLRERHERLGIDEVVVADELAGEFLPVLRLLAA